MINSNELKYGLRPRHPQKALAAFGARAIFQNGKIDFLPDRQSCLGETDASKTLCAWTWQKALPELKKYIRKKGWTRGTQETFTLETWLYRFDASPCASDGYLYMTSCMKGTDTFPCGKFSGDFIPEIGETVLAAINNIGRCKVIGYYRENGWIGVIALPENPPKWFIQQNGENAACGLFGVEIRKINS